jgi:hypothetical protein
MRCKELNLPICRLALFLDPRYKAAVDTPANYRGLIETVSIYDVAYLSLYCEFL